MTPISFVPAQSQSASTAAQSSATLSQNFDTFLTILTAQIQNQDPLEPLDSAQFTEQLVQFSGVEQQIRSNEQLETLNASSRTSIGASLAGYLGRDAEIAGGNAGWIGEPVTWRYALPADAASVQLSIVDSEGTVVRSFTGETGAGAHDLAWDGHLATGGQAPHGAYRLQVTASDANGETLAADLSVIARVMGVDLTYGEPALTTTAGVYSYSSIRRLTDN
jgi:flagellar basal-body rod modification protein FlgD